MPRKQANKSPTRSPTKNENDQLFERRSFIRKGGSAYLEQPGSKTDWRVGIVMAICLPLSLLIFWKITLPVMGWTLTSIVGSEMMQKLGFLKQDIFSMMTAECPMWIPAKEQAFLDDRSHDDILRVSDVSKEDFEEIVRRGEPVIVTDALRDWEAFGLYNCGYFMRKFPEAVYFDWQGQEYISLGNITKRPGFTGLKCASGYIETDLEANKKYAKLAGVKNWSVSWPVKDGSGIRWRKPIVFTLYPGETMFWYAAMRHHTEVMEDCSLSFSFLLKTPAPADYFHKLVQDLSSVTRAERDALFKETQTSCLDYIDRCGIMEEKGQTFIT